MTLDIGKLAADIQEFKDQMLKLGIPCEVQFLVNSKPVQVPTAVPLPGGPAAAARKADPITPENPAAAKKKKPNVNRDVPGKILKCLYCDRSMDTRTLHRHSITAHKDLYDKAALTDYIRGTPVSALVSGPAADSPSPGSDAKQHPSSISPNEIDKGMRVRQVKPDKGRTFSGTGMVTSRVGGLYRVDLGNGDCRTIDAACLEAA